MENPAQYHRDIYSGMVAKALGDNGYFGDECSVYGFLAKEGTDTAFCAAETEMDCATQYWQKLLNNSALSPMVSQKIRGEQAAVSYQTLCDALHKQLAAQYPPQKLRSPLFYDAAVYSAQWAEQLRRYLQQLSPEQMQSKRGALRYLLALAHYHGYLGDVAEMPPNDTPLEQKQFFGFAYWTDDQWHFYGNAYFPTALAKWLAFQKSQYPLTGIVGKGYPLTGSPYQQKNAFLQALPVILDSTLLKLSRGYR